MDSNDLNAYPGLVLWFDDLGSGNEEFRFLSNFYQGAPLTIPGITWGALFPTDDPNDEVGPVEFLTGEHAFAAMKFSTYFPQFEAIVKAPDPGEAKALGRSRQHPLRPDWEIVKLDVMAAVVRSKFAHEREEGERLLATGDKMLVEGTWWQDDVWGVDLSDRDMPGRNWLGTLLMARRAELRATRTLRRELVNHFADETARHNAKFLL